VTALRIHYDVLQNLYTSSLAINKIGRKITELLYIRRTKHDFALVTKSARERYADLVSYQPDLIKSIPQKYLSSYLGIKPESLSRLRSRYKHQVN
jgi:hypothetical protein